MLVAGALVAGGTFFWWYKLDGGPPVATLEGGGDVVGRKAAWVVNLSTPGRSGLAAVVIRLVSGDLIAKVAERRFDAGGWTGNGVHALRIPIEVDLGELGTPEGPAALEVLAETHGWRFFDRQMPTAGRFAQTVDRTPPKATVISDQHNIRRGGSAVGVFRIATDAATMEVRVGAYRFPVVRGYFNDESLALAVFAVTESLLPPVQPFLYVADAVGNDVEIPIFCSVRDREFRDRSLRLSDSFLQRKVPQLYAEQGLGKPEDLLEGYLRINREVRKRSEAKLRELTRHFIREPLWDGRFRRLSRSQTMSHFGDRRSYVYDDKIVDRQTHLGVDLASLERAKVEAAQNGKVVLAGDLGIYGTTVVIDHGLGVFTLYGHLSSLAVSEGESVESGHVIGRTGQTGLAGGDHLHYSTMVHGVHVDPVEWWDERWMKAHVQRKLSAYPRHSGTEVEDSDGQEAP